MTLSYSNDKYVNGVINYYASKERFVPDKNCILL